MVVILSNYVTVSTKVRKEVVEKARRLGIKVSEFLRKSLEDEVARRELEEAKKKLEDMDDALEKIDVDRVVQSIREDREGK